MKETEYKYGDNSIRVVKSVGDPFFCMGEWQIPDEKVYEALHKGEHKRTFKRWNDALAFLDSGEVAK